jgi:hypothetical protein
MARFPRGSDGDFPVDASGSDAAGWAEIMARSDVPEYDDAIRTRFGWIISSKATKTPKRRHKSCRRAVA